MELKISELQLPEKIVFNYAELKAEVSERIKKYETLVYTDADIKDAKADRADLNKLKKALNDERIRLEKEYLQPFNNFKTEINEIIGIIDVPVGLIDKQIKEVEKRKKEDKKAAVKELYEKIQHPAWLEFELLFREDWLKSSYSLSHIEKQVLPDHIAVHIKNAETLVALPEFGFEAMEVYKKSLDMAEALNKAKEMSEIAKKKAEQMPTEQRVLPKPQPTEEASEETVVKEASGWVSFSALLTVSQAKELKEFFNSRNIKFRPMKGE
jgi:hypothetical protein